MGLESGIPYKLTGSKTLLDMYLNQYSKKIPIKILFSSNKVKLFNPYSPNATFLYSLKTSENLRFSAVFRGEKCNIGRIWVNKGSDGQNLHMSKHHMVKTSLKCDLRCKFSFYYPTFQRTSNNYYHWLHMDFYMQNYNKISTIVPYNLIL